MQRAVAQLDALYLAYVDPGLIPPGAFVPEKHEAKPRPLDV